MKTALTIAGSDPCGGAGIQADIKAMTANGVYAMSAVTVLTAQNTTCVADIMEVTPSFLGKQLDSIFTDIYPDAVKIGMVSSARLIETISERLEYYQAKNIVIDPVMISSSGSKLLRDDALETLKRRLLGHAVLITPNIPEAAILSGLSVENGQDMMNAAAAISKEFGCSVLCKGGHSIGSSNDLLYHEHRFRWFWGERIDNPNTHGTGCTLSSVIACGLAQGKTLEASVQIAKEYIKGALKAMLDLGRGSGPLDHMWNIENKEK